MDALWILRFEKSYRYISDQSSKDVSKCAVDHLNESRKLHICVDENDGQTSVIWSPGWGDPHDPKTASWAGWVGSLGLLAGATPKH